MCNFTFTLRDTDWKQGAYSQELLVHIDISYTISSTLVFDNIQWVHGSIEICSLKSDNNSEMFLYYITDMQCSPPCLLIW